MFWPQKEKKKYWPMPPPNILDPLQNNFLDTSKNKFKPNFFLTARKIKIKINGPSQKKVVDPLPIFFFFFWMQKKWWPKKNFKKKIKKINWTPLKKKCLLDFLQKKKLPHQKKIGPNFFFFNLDKRPIFFWPLPLFFWSQKKEN